MERDNQELLGMAQAFEAVQKDYLNLMQGVALLYRALQAQAAENRKVLH